MDGPVISIVRVPCCEHKGLFECLVEDIADDGLAADCPDQHLPLEVDGHGTPRQKASVVHEYLADFFERFPVGTVLYTEYLGLR